jgi:ketosteroid isomerase-like protein
MSIEENVQTVKDLFAAIGRGDTQALLALSAEDIEWIIPGEDWPLAGTHRGHAGLADVLQKASEMDISSTACSRCTATATGRTPYGSLGQRRSRATGMSRSERQLRRTD